MFRGSGGERKNSKVKKKPGFSDRHKEGDKFKNPKRKRLYEERKKGGIEDMENN